MEKSYNLEKYKFTSLAEATPINGAILFKMVLVASGILNFLIRNKVPIEAVTAEAIAIVYEKPNSE